MKPTVQTWLIHHGYSTESCFFTVLYKCTRKKGKLQNGYKTRIETVIKCSRQLNDGYHVQLESLLVSEPDNPYIEVHKLCVSRYKSPTNVQAHVAHVRRKSSDDVDNDQSAPKRLLSSVCDLFIFRTHCLFCPTVARCLFVTEYDAKVSEQHRKRAFKIRSTVKADGHININNINNTHVIYLSEK